MSTASRTKFIYIGVVCFAAAALWLGFDEYALVPNHGNVITTLALICVTVIASSMRIERSTDPNNQISISLDSPFIFATVLVLSWHGFVFCVFVVQTINWLKSRFAGVNASLYELAFSISNFVINGAAALFVLHALHFRFAEGVDPTPLGIALAAAVAMTLVNITLTYLFILSVAGQSSVGSWMRKPDIWISDIAMTSLGLPVAAVWSSNPWLVLPIQVALLFILPGLSVPELKRKAQTDGRTGLLTATAFDDAATRFFERARQREESLCLILLDIDHFKNVNDSYGHVTGDAVLARLGTIVGTMSAEPAVAGRVGGEEFGVLLPGVTLQGAIAFAERARLSIERETFYAEAARGERVPFRLTISAGIALLQPAHRDVFELKAAADRALYRAKEAGRNRHAS
jgi:diguanylate cyclase (GGDEF)-like protein